MFRKVMYDKDGLCVEKIGDSYKVRYRSIVTEFDTLDDAYDECEYLIEHERIGD